MLVYFLLLVGVLSKASGFRLYPNAPKSRGHTSCLARSATSQNVESVGVKSLDPDFAYNFVTRAVTESLNREWIPLSVHDEIGRVAGATVKKSLASTEENSGDLGYVLLQVGVALGDVDFADSFVDPWTVANKV